MGFNGVWVQDKRRSTSLDLHLEALNVPYLARAVARTASYKANIEQVSVLVPNPKPLHAEAFIRPIL